MQLKHDGGPIKEPFTFFRQIREMIQEGNKSGIEWILDDRIPILEELRTKIQLVRRFAIPEESENGPLRRLGDFGINVSEGWMDNENSQFLKTGTYKIFIQDHWNLAWALRGEYTQLIEEKFKELKHYLEESSQEENQTVWHINFASACSPGDGLEVSFGLPKTWPRVSGSRC